MTQNASEIREDSREFWAEFAIQRPRFPTRAVTVSLCLSNDPRWAGPRRPMPTRVSFAS